MNRYQGLVTALAGGVCAGAALLYPKLWPLALLGVAGYFASTSHYARSWQSASLHGLLFGLLASAGGVAWFFDTLPLSWLSVPQGPIEWYLVSVVYLLTVLSLALPFALLAPLIRYISLTAWYRLPVLAFLFAFIEELRLWSFALFFLAPESRLAPDFSVAGLGYALIENTLTLPLAQAGIFGLAVALGLVGALLADAAYLRKLRMPLVVGTVALVLVTTLAHLALPPLPNGPTTRFALLATQIPPGPLRDPAPILALLSTAAESGADVIAIPEGLGITPFFPDTKRRSFYDDVVENETLIISSTVVKDPDGNERAELTYESSVHGVLASQDKIFFVPVGEYLPPLIRFVISAAGTVNLHGYGNYIDGRPVPGSDVSAVTYNDLTIGALMCSEMLSPRLYRDAATTYDTNVLINVANNSWFHGSRLLHARLTQVARMHALWNRQYVLVAANDSPAYAIDPRGNIIAESAWGVTEILTIDIPRAR